ncbi:hypothetical protein C8Q80DRAFT_317171 [Daedaleopsis nitida]|nr:hypothetical protein C8Q80DRAFT_317171 [Daedaleopsis nitida]
MAASPPPAPRPPHATPLQLYPSLAALHPHILRVPAGRGSPPRAVAGGGPAARAAREAVRESPPRGPSHDRGRTPAAKPSQSQKHVRVACASLARGRACSMFSLCAVAPGAADSEFLHVSASAHSITRSRASRGLRAEAECRYSAHCPLPPESRQRPNVTWFRLSFSITSMHMHLLSPDVLRDNDSHPFARVARKTSLLQLTTTKYLLYLCKSLSTRAGAKSYR